jgi:hypothetical protein
MSSDERVEGGNLKESTVFLENKKFEKQQEEETTTIIKEKEPIEN